MNENGLAIVQQTKGTALENYRDRDEVRELAQRLLSLHPAAKEVGQAGMTAVAQLALLVGASPLPGTNEIHVWLNEKTGKVQFALGINYFRRRAQELGGILWKVQPRQMRDDERLAYGIGQGQIAALCRAVRASDMEKYLRLGFTANQIWEMVGAAGIGVCGPQESKNGRPAVWTALKRAETDIYRQLFPFMWNQVEEAAAADVVASEPRILEEVDVNELLFGDEGPDPFDDGGQEDISTIVGIEDPADAVFVVAEEEVSAEQIRAELVAAAEKGSQQPVNDKQRKFVVASLSKALPAERDRHAVTEWLFGAASTSALTSAQASAIINWIGANRDNGYEPDPVAVAEAGRLLDHVLKEQGQLDLFFEEPAPDA
jgi:hypothetical protein